MTRIPDPEQTPLGPAYEGRLLDRPDDEVVDQGAPFDVRTLITRRGILSLVGIGLGTAALAACAPAAAGRATSSPTPTLTPSGSASPTASSAAVVLPGGEIPEETAGPYPGDGSNGPDALEMSGIVRSDLTTSIGSSTPVDGVPLTFTFTLTDMADGDAPLAGAAVYAWHCDALGRYSMYSSGVENENWLRGVQVSDANGRVTFTSIVPGCYTGRWPHIHFEVYPSVDAITDSGNVIATSQLAFPESMFADIYALPAYEGSARELSRITLAGDMVFGEDNAALQMATMSGDASSGYTAALTVRVDAAS